MFSIITNKNLFSKKNLFIVTILAAFMIITFLIRILPFLLNGGNDILSIVESDDPLYCLRQIEYTIHNFPAYGWFEAMTEYPRAAIIHWGPLTVWICSVLCILLGATSRPEIIQVSLIVPPLMAVAMVPVTFLFVRLLSDWKSGLVAAGLVTVIDGQYFLTSLYGYLDHHTAEVLFSTLFCLAYTVAVVRARKSDFSILHSDQLKSILLLSLISGIFYTLGFLVMPTMVLFAVIVTIFTVFQSLFDWYHNKSLEYLLIVNVITFLCAILGSIIIGFSRTDLSLNFYTIAHPAVYLLIILGTLYLCLISRYLKGKSSLTYPVILVGTAIIITAVLIGVLPQLFNAMINGFEEFFLQSPIRQTILEASSWSWESAWGAFSYSLILMGGGFVVLLYKVYSEERPDLLFILVWSGIMLFATIQHFRYTYYLVVNIVIASAFWIGFSLDWSWKYLGPYHKWQLHKEGEKVQEVQETQKTMKKSSKKGERGLRRNHYHFSQTAYASFFILVVTIGLTGLFAWSSITLEYTKVIAGEIRMNPDWRESLEWLGANTPDTGVDYYKAYDAKTFKYPETSYGVMSWWDYGHQITYIAKRIPHANPFQSGIGSSIIPGASSFFVTHSEETAAKIADELGTKYVMTDIDMAIRKFGAMATWYSTVELTPYQVIYLAPDQSKESSLSILPLYTPLYYETMISRLHTFDGSMAEPKHATYIEYLDAGTMSGYSYPVIQKGEIIPADEALRRAEKYNTNSQQGNHAAVVNYDFFAPITKVPALQHFRLVHESPSKVLDDSDLVDDSDLEIHYVKVFEYVKGACIRDEGVIEVQIVTDGGRQFLYRQESVNGEFVVPYATSGSPYATKAVGKYRVIGTGKEYDVPEEAVVRGETVA
jgi:dolichyl-diphosphooligosaccharide--protein glycosyltransferase